MKRRHQLLITIKRSTGWIGSPTKMQIIINGAKVETISNDQTLDVELPSAKNSLKVRQFGVASNEVDVRDGDILEVKYNQWHIMLLPLMIFVSFIMSVILLLPYKSAILPVHILFLIVIFVTKGFNIKKTNS